MACMKTYRTGNRDMSRLSCGAMFPGKFEPECVVLMTELSSRNCRQVGTYLALSAVKEEVEIQKM